VEGSGDHVFFGKSPKVPELAWQGRRRRVYFTTISVISIHRTAYPAGEDSAQEYYPQEDPDPIHLWGFAAAQVFTEGMKRMGKDNITRAGLVESLEGIKGWKESVVPDITIGKGNAPEHFLVKDMSYVVYKDGNSRTSRRPG
jgi:hypothetical protein